MIARDYVAPAKVEATETTQGVEIKGLAYIEFYVGNVCQTAHFFRTAFGFKPVAYASPDTGERRQVGIVLEQGDIRLKITGALSPDSPIAEHVHLHGDSVKDVAFTVDDVEQALGESLKRGARLVSEPEVFDGEQGRVVKATIAARSGDTVHSLIQLQSPEGPYFPQYRPIEKPPPFVPAGLTKIDHVAISVGWGELDEWVDFYQRVLGFQLSHEENIETEYSAMNSRVVQNRDGSVTFPMMEPARAKRKSQIEEYLMFHNGPGVQHIAMLSENIAGAVQSLRDNSVEFLSPPDVYYDMLKERIGGLPDEFDLFRKLEILIDRDELGYLMQTFTKPLHNRPTVFIEIIQRAGALGFGGGNIKALFQAIEREQALRGNL